METVSTKFREQEYSGEALYKCNLTINNTLIPIQQIANIIIKSPIIDTTSEMFYIGTFISQTLTIKFKNLDGIDIQSNYEVSLSIGQDIYDEQQQTTTEEIVPIGVYLIDDLAENYETTCEITCMDYAVKFKPNIDYSPCFVDDKADVNTIIEYICQYFGVTLATDLTTLPNGDVEVGTYDSTVSGKQWLSYLAEIKGCNLKMNRNGELIFIPFKKDEPDVEIDALKSAEFELGEKYEISRVLYFDALRNYTYGDDSANTLFIRQDNPFITDTNVVKNIYDSLMIKTPVELEEDTSIDLDLETRYSDAKLELKGNTYQKSYNGKNLLDYVSNIIANNYGLTNTINSDGSITTTGIPTANYRPIINTQYFIDDILEDGQTYTISQNNANSRLYLQITLTNKSTSATSYLSLNSTNTKTFTVDKNTYTYKAIIQTGTTNSWGTSSRTITQWYLLEKGSTATDFEKFVGGTASPNPDYPQNIEVVTGRNEIEISSGNLLKVPDSISQNFNGLTFTLNEDGGVTITGTSTQNAGFNLELDTPIVLNGDYTFSLKCVGTISQNTAQQWLLRDSNNANVGLNPQVSSNLTSYNTANINKTVSILRIYMVANTTFDCTIYPQLEHGTQYSNYKQYKGIQTYEVNLGKNLFDKDNANILDATIGSSTKKVGSSNQYKCIYIPCKPNTTYTIQKVQSGYLTCGFTATIPSNNVDVDVYTNFATNTTLCTITSLSTSKYLVMRYYRTTDTLTEAEIRATIQIEVGNQATSYSAYKTPIEMCKIGEYQDEIRKSTGKNLFDKTSTESGIFYNESDGSIISSEVWSQSNYIEINNTNYLTLSSTYKEPDRSFEFTQFNSSKQWISSIQTALTSGDRTFELNNNTKYIKIGFRNDRGEFNIQLEKGNQATDLEPYGVGVWYKYNKIGKVILDGTENGWSYNSNNVYFGLNSYLDYLYSDGNITYYCDNYSSLAQTSQDTAFKNNATNYNYAFNFRSTSSRLRIKNINYTDINTFKTNLGTNPITLYYVLSTPTVTVLDDELSSQLDALENIILYEGINHITTNTNNLEPYLKLSYTSLDTFKIWSLKNKNYGDISLDAWDLIQFNLGNESYQTYNDNTLTYEMNIATDISVQIPTKQKEVTTNVVGGNNDTKIKRLRTTVNNLENQVEIVVEEQDTQHEQISQLTIAVDEIEAQISDIPTITTEAQGTGTLSVLNLANVKLISLRIHPTTEDIIGLFASNELKAKNGLTALSRGVTFECNKKTYYMLPDNLYQYNNVSDEFVYNGVENKIFIIHRIGFDENDNKFVLGNPIIEEFEYQDLIIEEGNNYIYMDSYPSAYIYVKAMIKNDYTSTFATKVEVDSEIKQTANDITLQVSKKVDENQIISKINQSPEEVSILASKIKFEGEDVTITSGDISGFGISNEKFYKGLYGKYNYSLDDAILVILLYLNILSTGTGIDEVMDYNEDGRITLGDAVNIVNIVANGYENTRNFNGKFEINSEDLKNCIKITKDNKIITSIGLGGINTEFLSTKNFVCGRFIDNDFIGTAIRYSDGNIYISKADEAYTQVEAGKIQFSNNNNNVYFEFDGEKLFLSDINNGSTQIEAGKITLVDGNGNVKVITP